jgi:hypothetical protein
MIAGRPLVLAGLLCTLGGATVGAQSDEPALRPKHITLAAGWIVSGSYPVGDRNAELRRNAAGTPPPFTLFRADAELGLANGIEARVGYAITRSIAVEAGGTYTKPQLAIAISEDSESPEAMSIVDEITQYTVDVAGVIQLPLRFGARARPYAIAGASYLRQLGADRLLVETGRVFHVGGGIRYWLRGGSAIDRALGVRAEARYSRRTGGLDFEDQSRGYPSFSVLAFAGF